MAANNLGADAASAGSMRRCRLLIDPPAAGPWNMAVDEALLDRAAEQGGSEPDVCTLRFYRWSEPTLSLGYFQQFVDRRRHAASSTATVVRRSSGGGAILHDRELTYSLTLPGDRALAGDSSWLYSAVHDALLAALAEFGIQARQHGQTAGPSPAEQPFLCFERRAPGDVVLGSAKICGSAQRRRHGALLQHGSLILARSPAAPELPGLAELAAGPIDETALIRLWSTGIAQRLGLSLEPAELPADLALPAQRLVAEKFSHSAWTCRR